MADVFISYKREELALAAAMARALEAEGYSAFYDVGDSGIHAGETWDKRLEQELSAARCCVVLWSPRSVESDNVRSEARRARGRDILVPALVAACEPPLGLDTLQSARLVDWNGDRADPQWRFLVDRGVARKVGRPAGGAPRPAPPKQPPQRDQRPERPKGPARRVLLLAAGLVLVAALGLGLLNRGQPPASNKETDVNSPSLVERDPKLGAAPLAETSAPTPGETFRDCTSCPLMVAIPAGSFVMGSPEIEEGRSSDEDPQRTVRVGAFAAGVHEVSFGEWDACVSGGGCRSNPSPGERGWGRGSSPAINVSWNDAQEYVVWLSWSTGERYRLLTEAEWEYAARAGSTGPFWWGGSISPEQANYNGNFTYGGGPKGTYRERTVPVESFAANGFGLKNVHGNVWEWVEDCYVNSYAVAPSLSCPYRVNRGGGLDNQPSLLRSANRGFNVPVARIPTVGFRVARTVSPSNP